MNSVKRCNKMRHTTRKNDIGQFSKSLLFMFSTDHNKKKLDNDGDINLINARQ